jgi:hypothetical protein
MVAGKLARIGTGSTGIAFDRQTIQDATMKTLWLRTVNDDPVYEDSNKQATLDSTKVHALRREKENIRPTKRKR